MDYSSKCNHMRLLLPLMIATGTIIQGFVIYDFGANNLDDKKICSINIKPNISHTTKPSIIIHTTTEMTMLEELWYKNFNKEISTEKSTRVTYKDHTTLFQTSDLSGGEDFYARFGSAIGAIMGHWIAGCLCIKCNARNVVGYSALITSVCNMFNFASDQSTEWSLFFLRWIIAFFSSIIFPGFFTMIAHWSPVHERAFFTYSLLLGVNITLLILEPVYNLITVTMSREAWYCTVSLILLAWSIVWFSILKNSPLNNSRISYAESVYITESQEAYGYHQIIMQSKSIPWKDLLLSVPVWSLVFAMFCHCWNISMINRYSNCYISSILDRGITSKNLYGLFIPVCHIIGGAIFSLISAILIRKNILKSTITRKILPFTTLVLPGILTFLQTAIGGGKAGIYLLFIIALLNSSVVSSLLPNSLDIAPTLVGIIWALIFTFCITVKYLVPITMAELLDKKNLISSWRKILSINGSIYLAGAIVFLLFSSADLQLWSGIQQVRLDVEAFSRKYDKMSMPKVLSDIMEESESGVLNTNQSRHGNFDKNKTVKL